MQASPLRARLLPLFGIVGLALAAAAAPALGDAAPAGSAAASASTSPLASASVAEPPAPPIVRGADIPLERSKPPSGKEWSSARVVSPTRPATYCKLLLLREWLRVECADQYAAGLTAGSPKDVRMGASGRLFDWDPVSGQLRHSVIAIELPIERGKARIFSLVSVEATDGYGGLVPAEGAQLHVAWREGAADPVIAFTFP